MIPQEIIRRKRDGQALSTAEIEFVVRGITDASLGDGQVAAFAMAVFFRGMDMDERVALTRAMTQSGRVLDWRGAGLGRPILDKHSTGGVGDKVSLMLAPLLAACGGAVPMISGRGLGHTGGTLDKMQAIPGYDVFPDAARLRAALEGAGCAIVGATAEIAPADRRLYALRDVTATVESIPLITASILSKKLAAGLDALVLDCKTGSGAFMAKLDDTRELARSLVSTANGAGMRTAALITDMNQVLGWTAGNAVEAREAVEYLTGLAREPRLHEVTLALTEEILVLGGLAADNVAARAMAERALASGAAAERFGRMVAAMGGPADFIEHMDRYLARAAVEIDATATHDGYIAAIDTRAVGVAIIELGGGRRDVKDTIDASVGLTAMRGIGDRVGRVGRDVPLARIHARTRDDAARAAASLRQAVTIAPTPPAPVAPVYERIGP